MSSFDFVRTLIEVLTSYPDATLQQAAGKAYDQVLAPIHTLVIRTAVRAGLLMLPSRQDFIQASGPQNISSAG